jgi:bla regulator protein blaR1
MSPSQWQPLMNHLWQSTLFAAATSFLMLALRTNRAQIRYSLWLTASVKFLIPFSVLVTAGSHLGQRAVAPIPSSDLSLLIRQVSTPFPKSFSHTGILASQPSPVNWIPPILCAVWAVGFATLICIWWLRWRRMRAVLCTASALCLPVDIKVVNSPAFMEPGVFGIRRPILLLPEGITSRLTPEQFEAILAHALCHVRRRDNLTAAIHMIVEALFWFHPLVWWLGARLMEERERACDEEVLRLGNLAEVYAEGILKVCELYLESPLPCVAGVTGANLKRRIEAIMKNRIRYKLNLGRKLLLATAASVAVAGPLLVGMTNFSPTLTSQSLVTFEVASVKPHKPGDRAFVFPQFLPGGRFSVAGIPLQIVIAFAYNVPFQGTQLSGGPDWIRSMENVYDIEAKAEVDALSGLSAKDQTEKMRLMLQALLAERFKLNMRHDTREQPVYLLRVGKNGPKLQKSKIDETQCGDPANHCHQGGAGQGRGIHAKGFNMTDLVTSVSNFTDHPLIDRTGLNGLYDIDTEGWVPVRPRPSPPPGAQPSAEDLAFADPMRPTLYMIFERLGLKMESSKALVEMFVIDHVEKPTEN